MELPQQQVLAPIETNQKKGFYYSVTEEQMAQHLRRSVKDIFLWIEQTNRFVSAVRQPIEQARAGLAKDYEFAQ